MVTDTVLEAAAKRYSRALELAQQMLKQHAVDLYQDHEGQMSTLLGLAENIVDLTEYHEERLIDERDKRWERQFLAQRGEQNGAGGTGSEELAEDAP